LIYSRIGASEGAFGIVPISLNNAVVSKDFPVFYIDATRVTNEYLIYFLTSGTFCHIATKESFGATMTRLREDKLLNCEIELLPLVEQKRIIDILNTVKAIVSYHQNTLSKLDNLIKARFVEMFGTPFINEKQWDMKTIGDVVTEVRYGTSRPAVENGKYSYLRMNNLTSDGEIDLNNLKRIDIPEEEVEKCIVRKGDVLFNRTNSVELVGKTAMFNLDEDMIIAGYIIRIRLQQCLLPEILAQYMNLKQVKDLLRSMAKGAVNQANINAQELQSIKVYIPDIELQDEFVSFKRQVDKSKFMQ
jgi:type I restriction enzyme S subunit